MSWKRVRGHEARVEEFTRAVRRGRLAHAYLFVGPPGVGKRLFAVELARALLCEGPREDDRLESCDACPPCVQIDAGTNPDFLTAARPPEKAEFPIELMRELCQHFSLRSARGRGKVVVIDDADDLNEESANCFLKTLEEPPPGSVLILIGTSTDRQRATIVSRCQVVRFRPLPPEAVAEVLQANGVDDAAVRDRLARLGGGSPGQALALADPALWEFRDTLLRALTGPRLDPVALSKKWIEFVQEAGKEAVHQRRRARLTFRLLIDFLHAALVFGLNGQGGAGGNDRPLLEAMARRMDAEQIAMLLERCVEADFQVERNVGMALVLEALVDAFAHAGGTRAAEPACPPGERGQRQAVGVIPPPVRVDSFPRVYLSRRAAHDPREPNQMTPDATVKAARNPEVSATLMPSQACSRMRRKAAATSGSGIASTSVDWRVAMPSGRMRGAGHAQDGDLLGDGDVGLASRRQDALGLDVEAGEDADRFRQATDPFGSRQAISDSPAVAHGRLVGEHSQPASWASRPKCSPRHFDQLNCGMPQKATDRNPRSRKWSSARRAIAPSSRTHGAGRCGGRAAGRLPV